MEPLFTIPGIWSGGFYEMKLHLGLPPSNAISEALNALWNSPVLRGPFASRDVEPEEQDRIDGFLDAGAHLYGAAGFHAFELPCGTYSVREDNEERGTPTNFVALYFPLSAIGMHFAVGAYPFADHEEAGRWRAQIDAWLLNLLRELKERIPFDVCVIGWEPELTAANVEEVKNTTSSVDRFDGVVMESDGELHWFPPTRFDIITLNK